MSVKELTKITVTDLKSGFGAKKRLVLEAYGIRVDGKRELIDFVVTNAESQKMWWRFLNASYRR